MPNNQPPDNNVDDILDQAEDALDRGEIETARTLHSRARAIDPHDRDVLLLDAALCSAEDDHEGLVHALEHALEHYGDDPVALLVAAEYIGDDDPEEAISLLEEADRILEEAQEDPEVREDATALRARVLAFQSVCQGALGEIEEALETAQSAVLADPTSVEAALAAAGAEMDAGQLEGAIERLEKLLAGGLEEPEAHWLLGWAHHLLGREDAALASFARAQEIDDDYTPPITVSQDDLQKLVGEVIGKLPPALARYLANVPVHVEDLPALDGSRAIRAVVVLEGEPPVDRPEDERWSVRPTALRVYRKNIEVLATDLDEARAMLEMSIAEHATSFLGLEDEDDEEDAQED